MLLIAPLADALPPGSYQEVESRDDLPTILRILSALTRK